MRSALTSSLCHYALIRRASAASRTRVAKSKQHQILDTNDNKGSEVVRLDNTSKKRTTATTNKQKKEKEQQVVELAEAEKKEGDVCGRRR